MCGISGIIGRIKIDEETINNTLKLMENRGPDYQGYSELKLGDLWVYLLHSRLSIIDLDPRSNQPFKFKHLHLVFNGEIYNYVEIRKELISLGYHFETTGDAEVLIKSFDCWGNKMYDRLEGMWAFVIFDKKKGELHLSRDRFAEKPLYIYDRGDAIFFASEIKFLKSLSNDTLEINYDQIYRYLVNGYKSLYKNDETFYLKIKEHPYSSYSIITDKLVPKTYSYWDPKPNESHNLTLEDSIAGVKERLINSVRLRLRSDVPLAFCLSGGIDSASLVSIAAKVLDYDVHTFSIIDPDHRYNEYDNIMATVNDVGCKHTLINLKPKNMISRLKSLVSYHDGPVATISYLIHSMLSEEISANGYRVSISGTAADELLTGYYDHFNLYLYMVQNTKSFSSHLNDWYHYLEPIVRNPYLRNPKLYFDNENFRDHIYLNNEIFAEFLIPEFSERFKEVYFTDHLLHNRMLNELFYEGSRVILKEDDLNSMYYSIENRSPYLDRDLFEFSYSIPTVYLIQNGYAKFVLREAVKGILNDKVRLDRHKKGFNASINSLIDFNCELDRQLLLEDSPVYEIVKRDCIESLFKEGLENSYSKFLFNFLNIKIFLESHEG